MNKESKSPLKLSKISLIICIAAFLFSGISILITFEMNLNAQRMYEHPYTVSNSARAMRSRLWDMKSFSGILLSHAFQSEDDKDSFFQSRYGVQNEEIENIRKLYLGPSEDIDALKEAMDDLIEVQTRAVGYTDIQSEDEVREYMDVNVYPYYDRVNECLTTIIDFADAKIYSLKVQVQKAGLVSTFISLMIAFSTIGLTILSNRQERHNLEVMAAREHDLQDALYTAQQSGNAKKDFLSRMSHEIRTPMNVIVGMTAIAGANLDDSNRVKDCLSKIILSSKHLLALINDILDMSKIEEGKLSVSHEQFELSQLFDSIVPAIYSQAAAKGSAFECKFENTVSETVIGDSLRVSQILLNLLSNAIKFTPAGGTIRLIVSQAPVKDGHTMLTFHVEDNGIGMSEEFLQHLFTPFEQEDGSISRKYGGTGLGMAITKNLVGLLGGTIRVKSKQGEGTVFTIELPFGVLEETDKSEIGCWDDLKVLVVDDDEGTCTHASMLLREMGIDADWVQHGSAAVQMVLKAHEEYRDYDVCLIDWKMPDMDGIEVTRRIREEIGPDTLVIIISAYDWGEIENEAKAAGANAFIAKPLFESSLCHALSSVVGKDRGEGEECKAPTVSFEGKRFLLAEDNELNREIAVELLKAAGAEINCTENGKEAVDCFNASATGYYDLILMDIQMPVMNGYEAARAIRQSNHEDAVLIPILAMTANAFHEDEEEALAAGMNGHIAKPIDVGILFRTMSEVLR
ncbi:response regulator [Enterocloster citroniae]|uniref:Circadian input-output histidine kinase CikA n=1 Tax=[Clostridium] citroniae WAL-17108 TaxID=742733 RepID=G5HBQ2_9FIRM|nr:response regulator [Enterocloster citroniae]EHF01137.1 hypothetical protein HMPREF9469_00014 [ [[Clostridium] citroniae WAL-17108]MCC3382340.1 response regulator [Enterocloster citroniae]